MHHNTCSIASLAKQNTGVTVEANSLLQPLGMLAEVWDSPKIPFSWDLEIMGVGIKTGFPVLGFLDLDSFKWEARVKMCTTVHLHLIAYISNKLCKKSNRGPPCCAFQHGVILRNSKAASLKCLTEQKVLRNVMLCRFRRATPVEFTIKRRLDIIIAKGNPYLLPCSHISSIIRLCILWRL